MLLLVNPSKKTAERIRSESLKTFGLDERGLQAVLFNSLDRILPEDELLLVMQSRQWQEEPDLLAVGKTGMLYIFELKVWEARSENLLQVLRYGQIFGTYQYQDLDRLYRQQHADRSLRDVHKAKFGVDIREEDFNEKQRFIVLTNGLDVRTREAIRYWKKTGLDIQPWIYRAYGYGERGLAIELNPFRVEDDPYQDLEEGYYVLNTNYSNWPDDDAYMLKSHRAAAFSDPWKKKIERLKKGDKVFLYRSGVGIVAVGIASGKVERRARDRESGEPDDEYSMVLSNFSEVSPPRTPAEIKEITGANLVFRHTLFALDEDSGKRLYEHVRSGKPKFPREK